MAEKHLKKCSTSSHQANANQMTFRFHLRPATMAKINKTSDINKPRAGEDMEQGDHSPTAGSSTN